MKRTILSTLLALGFAGVASAGLSVPSSVFKMDELDEAKEKAAKDEEPLIIIYTDPTTS